MFEYIRGKLASSTPEKAVVEVGGVGYRLHVPFNTFGKLPKVGGEVLLYVFAHIREDCHRYFGFLTEQERDLFEQLNSITGIGPKTALALIGHMELGELQLTIAQKNVARLCRVPGIGKKTAERLVVELKDRVQKMPTLPASGAGKNIEDAIAALVNLGYPLPRSQKAVSSALESTEDKPELAELITLALRRV